MQSLRILASGYFDKTIDVGAQVSGIVGSMYETRQTNEEEKPIEQAKVAYLDVKTNTIKAITTTYGDNSTVDMLAGLNEAANAGGLPMMLVHEHPRDSMFSPDDYFPLIFGDKQTNTRVVNGIMVMTPGMQVMALATNETPLFSTMNDADNLIESHNQERIAAKTQLEDKGQAEIDRQLGARAAIEQTTKAIEDFAAKTDTSNDPKLQQLIANMVESKNKAVAETEQNILSADQEVKNGVPRLVNASLISLAREMHVKLYISTDKRNFKEFSA